MLLGRLLEVRLVLVVVRECVKDRPMKDLVESFRKAGLEVCFETGRCWMVKILKGA